MNIPYGRQHITEEDIQAVSEVLRGDYLTQGPSIAQFEQAFASYVGATLAAVSNGTTALHLAALALGVKPGTRVISTPNYLLQHLPTVCCIVAVRFGLPILTPTAIPSALKKQGHYLHQNPKVFSGGIIP